MDLIPVTVVRPRPRKLLRSRPTIGVLVGWQVYVGMLDGFIDQVFQGIIAGAAERECNLLLACGTGLPYGTSFGKPAWPFISPTVDFLPVGPWNCDGLIVLHPIGSQDRVDFIGALVDTGYPVVFSGDYSKGSAVTVDNQSGITLALDHLLAHGHHRIAFIMGRDKDIDGDSYQRFQAYLNWLQKHHIEVDPNLIAAGYNAYSGGQEAMAQILSRKVPFTALMANNDDSASGAMQTLQEAGLLVPQDIAVIGFDNRTNAQAQIPMLTTVHFPMFELGSRAVDQLLKCIDGTLGDYKNVIIPSHLVIRETCGCSPGMNSALRIKNMPAPLEINTPSKSADGSLPEQTIFSDLAQTIAEVVKSETHHLGAREVDYLCESLAKALRASLERGEPQDFSLIFQQILARASDQENDLFIWHEAISILRAWLPALMGKSAPALTRQQADNMFDQARVAISEISRGQAARQVLRQAQIADRMGQMTSNFFTAQNESEVFAELIKQLPKIGIAHASVAYYVKNGEDEPAWSELQTAPHLPDECRRRFPTRQFPPEGLYTEPYSLALLPMTVQRVASGFVAFETGNLELCSTIALQLAAALRGIHLYREAIAARQSAEIGKQMAEEAGRLKNRFLSWVVHELRTPLNLVYGLSDMLLEESKHTQADKIAVNREDIARIHFGADHLVRMIRDVLDLALSEMGQLKLVRAPLDLTEELRAIADIGKQLAQEKGLAWRAAIDEHLPQVLGDRTRIRQVLLNLISNAVKFTAKGEVALEARSTGDRVMITIRDTGLGIPRAEQDLIFEEFRQSERTSERGYGGLGLGLAICKRLVEMHGGQIGVHSSGVEKKGSTFFFTLPALEKETNASGFPDMLLPTHKLLLLVNDNTDWAILKAHLEQQGYETQVQIVSAEIDWMNTVVSEHPEAVVLDLGMASRFGWEILKALKENPATQDVSVLFCSLEEGENRGSLLELGYMTKPVKSTDLTDALLAQGVIKGSDPQAARKTILIVDDEVNILEVHVRMIQTQFPNCQTILAHNGREALKLIRQSRPDLVLLDLMMPDMDGFAVLKAMQQEDLSRNTPVIVLTGQALSEEDMERLNCGVANVLGKGMYSSAETMQHLTDALLRRRKAGSETQRIVFKAIAYLHANYSAQITRKDLAEYVGLSERHLTRCFNLELGLTPMTYLNRYRVQQSKTLLEAGRKSIAEIAEKVGFSSGGYFTRVFQDEVGISPREYAKGKREG
jgi:signal transduction histidine kinase/DNA-binding response OmpR family regulator/ABC-type sugar transport system substrate-binding protein